MTFWFLRGGNYNSGGSIAGVFYFNNNNTGGSNNNGSFRLVMRTMI